MAISNDWNINYLTKQINHLQWTDEITGTDSSIKEVTSVTTIAASGITTGDYFFLYSATDATAYYVWYNKATGGGNPNLAGKTGIEVAIGASDTDTQVATATRSAIDALADFVGTGSGTEVIITNADFGSCTDASDFNAGFTITVTTQGVGKTVWSVNALYSFLQDTFDELGQMDDKVPMSAQTPTEYSLINNWFIDEVSIKYLKGGAIKTIGWTGGEIRQIGYNSNGGAHMAADDIGRTITGTTTTHAGKILFFDERTVDNDQGRLWIRPTTVATDLFNNGTEAYTIGGSSAAGVFTSVSATGENTWANMFTLGTLETNTAIYIIQDKAKITAWWPVGQIDVLVRVQEAGSTTGSGGGNLGTIFIGGREYSKLFDHFVSTGITGGRNPVPLATATDLNNTTGQYTAALSSAGITFAKGDRFTVSGTPAKEGTVTDFTASPATSIDYYLSGTSLTQFAANDVIVKVGTATPTSTISGSPTNKVADYATGGNGISMVFADANKDLNNGSGSKPYDVVIDLKNTKTVAQMYEWLKFVTRRGYAATPQQLKTGTGSTADTNIDGEQYIDLLTSFTPVKASPFGTFAGGKFFGAQGVWLDNVPSADAQNYQLIDSNGATQTPPNTVQVIVSSIVAGDRVGVFVLTAASGTVKKNTYTNAAQATGLGTITVGSTINSETPQAGVIRVVDDSDTLKAEQQYEYKSRATTIFTLRTLYSAGTPGTATGSSGSATILIDTDGTSFISGRVRPGDKVTNQTTGGTALVVSVDSATQITTTTLSTGVYNNDNAYYIETVTDRAYTTSDSTYVPIINEQAITTSVSNSLIKDTQAAAIPVLIRVRLGKVILPFEIENTIGNTGMSQAAIRTPDTIAT